MFAQEFSFFYSTLLSFIGFFLFGSLGLFLFRYWALASANKEAQELLSDAKEDLALVELDLKEKTTELEQEIFSPHEQSLQKTETQITEKLTLAEEKKQLLEKTKTELDTQYREGQSKVDKYNNIVLQKKQSLDGLATQKVSLTHDLTNELAKKSSHSSEELIDHLKQQEIQHWQSYFQKWILDFERYTQQHSDLIAKKYLNRMLSRFHRPYCSERGIPAVYFNPEKSYQRQILCDPNGNNQKTISKVTGCDILIEADQDFIAIGGFDPVRREYARRLLEKCLKERSELTPAKIENYATQIRKELFSQIKRDGDLLAKELGLQGLHVEIRKMMGSLRYRYSFTQNQYYHCAEVGWLSGLMASELGDIDFKKARRSGLLHDLGKAMDHEFDGGHAVIGAQFIEKWGESADVVHAVRAHHYDETPSTHLAYAVIASDAVSGARPGVRRSTVETYTQKINDLENIALSFKGVYDCIVLNGGRECRIKVDSHILDDLKTAEVAKLISEKIESELSYPGQIKIVVVRETVSVESKSPRHN